MNAVAHAIANTERLLAETEMMLRAIEAKSVLQPGAKQTEACLMLKQHITLYQGLLR